VYVYISSACRLLLLVCCMAYSSTLKMEVIRASGMLDCLRTTRRYNPEVRPHSHAVRTSNAT
jgi:hypothetical protein